MHLKKFTGPAWNEQRKPNQGNKERRFTIKNIEQILFIDII